MNPEPPPLQFAHHGDVDIAHLDWGDPPHADPGLPLLVIAGLGGGRLAYPTGFLHALGDAGFHVATYDPRDVGASTRFTGTPQPSPGRALLGRGKPAYTAEDLTDDAAAVLDALGWDRTHVFGMSLGGLVAQRLALRHPDRVASLTSMSAMPSDAGALTGLPAPPAPRLHPQDRRPGLPRHPRGRHRDRGRGRPALRLTGLPLRRARRPQRPGRPTDRRRA